MTDDMKRELERDEQQDAEIMRRAKIYAKRHGIADYRDVRLWDIRDDVWQENQ